MTNDERINELIVLILKLDAKCNTIIDMLRQKGSAATRDHIDYIMHEIGKSAHRKGTDDAIDL